MWQQIKENCRLELLGILSDYLVDIESSKIAPGQPNILKAKIKELHSELGKQRFYESMRYGLIDLFFATVVAWSLTLLTYWITIGAGNTAIMSLLLSIDLVAGFGGISSLYRTSYFLIVLGIPIVLSSKFSVKEKWMRLSGCFLTCFEGGWVISPILRSLINEDLMVHKAVWRKVQTNFLLTPKKLLRALFKSIVNNRKA